MAEQVELLRRLWTERAVTHAGPDERVAGAGIAPRPVQRPIPVWFGGRSEPAYRRAGRLGDGWFPQVPPGPGLVEAKAIVEAAAAEAGRDPAGLGMEGRISYGRAGADAVAAAVQAWERAGATHVSVNTMGAGLTTVDGHIAALGAVAGAVGLPPA